MRKLDSDGAVVAPRISDEHKDFVRGVKTPAAQSVFFAAGAAGMYATIAFVLMGGVGIMDGLRWTAGVFGITLFGGLMLRMISGSVKTLLAIWAANRTVQERQEYQAQIAILLDQREVAKRGQDAPGESIALQTASLMIQDEFVRRATGHGGGWARDPYMGRHKAARRKDWEYAREILEGAGIRGSDGELLVFNLDKANTALLQYYARSTRLLANEYGGFSKG